MIKRDSIIFKILIILTALAIGTFKVEAACPTNDDSCEDNFSEDGYRCQCVVKPDKWGDDLYHPFLRDDNAFAKLAVETAPKCVYSKYLFMANGTKYDDYQIKVETDIVYDAGFGRGYVSAIYKGPDNYYGYEKHNNRIEKMDGVWVKDNLEKGGLNRFWPYSTIYFGKDRGIEVFPYSINADNNAARQHILGNGVFTSYFVGEYGQISYSVVTGQYRQKLAEMSVNEYGNIFCPSYVIVRMQDEEKLKWITFANTYEEAVQEFNTAIAKPTDCDVEDFDPINDIQCENNYSLNYSYDDFVNPRKYYSNDASKYYYVEILPLVELEGEYDPSTKKESAVNRKIAWYYTDTYESLAYVNGIKALYDRWHSRIDAFKQEFENIGGVYQGKNNNAGPNRTTLNGYLGKCFDATVGEGENAKIDVNLLNDGIKDYSKSYNAQFLMAFNTMTLNLAERDLNYAYPPGVPYPNPYPGYLKTEYSKIKKEMDPDLKDSNNNLYGTLDNDLTEHICTYLTVEYKSEIEKAKKELDEKIAAGEALTAQEQAEYEQLTSQINNLQNILNAFNNRLAEAIDEGDTKPLDCSSFGDVIFDVFKIIMIIAPILVVVFGSIDFAKATLQSDEAALKKAGQSFGKRIIAAVLLFLLPTIISLMLQIATSVGILEEKPDMCQKELTNK